MPLFKNSHKLKFPKRVCKYLTGDSASNLVSHLLSSNPRSQMGISNSVSPNSFSCEVHNISTAAQKWCLPYSSSFTTDCASLACQNVDVLDISMKDGLLLPLFQHGRQYHVQLLYKHLQYISPHNLE